MNYRLIKIIVALFLSLQLLARPRVGDEVEIIGTSALRYFNGKSFMKSELIGTLKPGEKRAILEIKPWKNTDGSDAYILRVGKIINGQEVSDGEIFYRDNSDMVKLLPAKIVKAQTPQVPIEEAKFIQAIKEIDLYDQLGTRAASLAPGERLKLIEDAKFYPQNAKAEWIRAESTTGDEYLINKKDFPQILIQGIKQQIEQFTKIGKDEQSTCPSPEKVKQDSSKLPARFNPNSLRASKNLLTVIRITEGCFLRPYICPAGYRTIGCGHRCDNACPAIITKEQMDEYLRNDILKFEKMVRDEFPKATFTQGQFDALVSMAFNMGNKFSPRKERAFARLIDKALAPGHNPTDVELLAIAGEITRYQYSNSDPLLGLQRRRVIESVLFTKNEMLAGLDGATGYPEDIDKVIRPIYEKMQSTIPEKYRVDYLGD